MKKQLILLITFLIVTTPSNAEKQNPKRIAVLICSKFSNVPTSTDNDGLKPAFENIGLTYEPVIWDQPNIDWKQYDAVLVRATWDYIDKYENFLKTISYIKKLGIHLINSFDTLVWNSNKTYLKALAHQGVPILRTIMVNKNQTPLLTPILNELSTLKYVIKPAISGGSHRTFVTDSQTIQSLYDTHYSAHEDVIIQEMAQEIISEGEWELVFFNGQFSHAILATPKEGDFRVQRMYGGTVKTVQPPLEMIEQAQRILRLVPDGVPLYARVDFVRRDTTYYLMELEIIEPSLYLKFDENACHRFAQALRKKLKTFESENELLQKYNQREPQYPSHVDRNHYGFCLCAACDLPTGTIVATADFEPTDSAYIADHEDAEHKYVALMNVLQDGTPVWGRIRGKWAFCNHSCDPNCDINEHFEIITNRAMNKGQELTTSYDALVPNFPWPESWNFVCLCEAENCKKIINKYRMDMVYPIKSEKP